MLNNYRSLSTMRLNSFALLVLILANTSSQKTAKFEYISPANEDHIQKQDKYYWNKIGLDYLLRAIKFDREPRENVAKNIIIFIGDGMGLSTITSTRIYKGQRTAEKIGEEYNLVYDSFPNVALVKNYNVDMQVPDSAGTATAMFTGVKTRYEALGLDVLSNATSFSKATYENSRLESIMTWAQRAKKHTGIVTTTRITHATPAATYAHVNNRYWECDSNVPDFAKKDLKDVARQLVEDEPGRHFKVILGGGYQFLGYSGNEGGECARSDYLNLTETWITNHKGQKYVFATNNEDLEEVTDDTEYLMGLFAPDHMPYELVRDKGLKGTPSITKMTEKALKILKKSENGFVLMVEGGLIDQAHHHNYARLALEESSKLEEAVALALKETGPETLILVTADHSHSFNLNGYSKRGNDILGYGIQNENQRPFLTLNYANGPGFSYHYTPNEAPSDSFPWRDARFDENRLSNPFYQHAGRFHLKKASHSGEDVPIYAKGPNSHLIRGVVEQNFIAHFISYTGCFGPHAQLNPYCQLSNKSAIVDSNLKFILVLFLAQFFVCFNF